MSEQRFPSTEEALRGTFGLQPGVSVGTLSTGSELKFVRVGGGKLETMEAFSGPKLDAIVLSGGDWISVDNDGKRLRLDAKILLKNHDGAVLRYKYIGIVTLTPEIERVLGADPAAATVPFGNIVSSGEFQTGDANYKEYEGNLFIGTGRFIVLPDKSIGIEYGLSKVVA